MAALPGLPRLRLPTSPPPSPSLNSSSASSHCGATLPVSQGRCGRALQARSRLRFLKNMPVEIPLTSYVERMFSSFPSIDPPPTSNRIPRRMRTRTGPLQLLAHGQRGCLK
ncbi:hypothetical protein INR49_005020 [Caranx melampygus]|nr:hypothetical protein INR49_005020 [Caranx melampygus]